MLVDVFEQSRAGNEEAFCRVCEIVDASLKPIVKRMLRRKGVVRTELFEEAWQEAMLAFVKHSRQVKRIRHLPYWLATTALRCAIKNQWPRHSGKKKQKQRVQQPAELPQPTGTKSVIIDGRQHEIKIYAPCSSPTTPLHFRPRLEQLTEDIIEKCDKTVPQTMRGKSMTRERWQSC